MKRLIDDIKKYDHYVWYAAKSELKSEVANSYLNWIWWILEPICFMLLYALVFGTFFGVSEQYFTTYIFIGITMWDFFNRIMKNSVKLIKNNKAIVSKVYIPKYMLIFVKILVNGFKLLIGFGIVTILLVVNQVPVGWNLIYVIPILLVLVLVTFGIASFLTHFGVYVEDLSNVVNIVLRLVFYLTGVFYSIEKRAKGIGKYLLHYNPMAFLLDSMRKAVLYNETPDYKWLLAWGMAGLILSFLGIWNIYRNENSYVKVI